LNFSRKIFEKYSKIKLHENPYGGSRAAPYGQTDTHDEAVSFRNFAIAPKNDTSVFTLFRTNKLV
jgi:hypothetical protein